MNRSILYWLALLVLSVLIYGCSNDNPVAYFTVSRTAGCYPLTVSFNATGSQDPDGSISRYSWNFGDGTTGSGATVNHTFTTTGSFKVVLTITDDDDATSDESTVITVSSMDGYWVGVVTQTVAEMGATYNTLIYLTQLETNPTVVVGYMQWEGVLDAWTGSGTINTQTNNLVIDWSVSGYDEYQISGTFTDDCRSFSGTIDGSGFSNDVFTMTWYTPVSQKMNLQNPSGISTGVKKIVDTLKK